MSRLNRYNDFYLSQMKLKQAKKISFINDIKIMEFQSVCNEGKNHDVVTLHLKNGSKVNENYSLILEDKEVLGETKKIVCINFYKDKLQEIAKDARFYLENRNILESDIRIIENNIELIFLNEGRLKDLANWIGNKVDQAGNWVEDKISKGLNWLSDSAAAVWNSIVDDVFKPGLEALRNVATKLFGPDVVLAIETMAKKTINSIDEFIETSKSVFDSVYNSLRDLAKNLANIVKDMWLKIKEVLMKIWQFIKDHALKVIPGLKPKLNKMDKVGEMIDGTKLSQEIQTLGQDVKDMIKGFTGELVMTDGASFDKVATSSGEKILSTSSQEEEKVETTKEETKEVISDSFIWNSLKGHLASNREFNTEELIKLHETKVNKIFEAEVADTKEVEETKDKLKKAESKGIKKWITGLAMWVLSPFGKLMEILGEVVAKGLSALPAWLGGKLGSLYEGVKNLISYAGKFPMIGVLSGFIAGVVAESFALTTHLPGKWIEKAGEMVGLGGAMETSKEFLADVGRGIEKTGISLTDMKKESIIPKFNDFNKINESEEGSKKGINWKGLAIGAGSALLAFLVSIFTHAIPGLHAAFETISLVVLIMATMGYIFTETKWGIKIAKKASKIVEFCTGMYKTIHAH